MKKYKKCKGINKANTFQGCENEVLAQSRKYGLCQSCFAKWLYSTEDGGKMLNKAINKGKNIVKSIKKTNDKKKREEVTNFSKKLQSKINQIVRFIDKDELCLAKGIFARQFHAGHIFSRGSNPTIKYNLHNIHRQSAQSNHFQNDDGLLREGLMNEYGIDYYNFVSELRRTPVFKRSNEEYKDLYRFACKLFNEISKDCKSYPKVIDRIMARNEINLKLNIYDKEYCVFKRNKKLNK